MQNIFCPVDSGLFNEGRAVGVILRSFNVVIGLFGTTYPSKQFVYDLKHA